MSRIPKAWRATVDAIAPVLDPTWESVAYVANFDLVISVWAMVGRRRLACDLRFRDHTQVPDPSAVFDFIAHQFNVQLEAIGTCCRFILAHKEGGK